MDLTKYKSKLNTLRQCIINVELAQTAYRTAVENCSYGMQGAEKLAADAKKQLESTERTLECQFRIMALQSNEEVLNER